MWYLFAALMIACVWIYFMPTSMGTVVLASLLWLFALRAERMGWRFWRVEVAFHHAAFGLVAEVLGYSFPQPRGKNFNRQERLCCMGMNAAIVWLNINIINVQLKQTVLNSNYKDDVCTLLHRDKCTILKLLQDETDSLICFLACWVWNQVVSRLLLRDTVKDILQRDYDTREHLDPERPDCVQNRRLTRFAQACIVVWLVSLVVFKVRNGKLVEETTIEWLHAMQMGFLLEVISITVSLYIKAMERKLNHPLTSFCWHAMQQGIVLIEMDYYDQAICIDPPTQVLATKHQLEHEGNVPAENSMNLSMLGNRNSTSFSQKDIYLLLENIFAA